jgi:hypothetical protein
LGKFKETPRLPPPSLVQHTIFFPSPHLLIPFETLTKESLHLSLVVFVFPKHLLQNAVLIKER